MDAQPWSKLKTRLGRKLPVLIAAGVIGLLCGLQALPRLFPGWHATERLEWITYDWRVRTAYNALGPAAGNLGVIFFDDESLDNINHWFEASWPWPRHLHARIVAECAAQGARAVAFDIHFRERHEDRPETRVRAEGREFSSDDYFAHEIRQAANVVLACPGLFTSQGTWEVLLPARLFATNALAIGHIHGDRDADSVLRRAKPFLEDPVRGRFWHLGIVLAAQELGLDLDHPILEPGRITLRAPHGVTRTIPTDRDGFFYIDWGLRLNDPRLHIDRFESVLEADLKRARAIAAGREPDIAPEWRDRLVVVGSIGTGNNISDLGATPLSFQTYLMSQHWNVANSVLLNRFVVRSSYLSETLLIVLLGAVSAVGSWRFRVLIAPLLIGAGLVVYVLLALLLFLSSRYWLPIILPCGALILTYMATATYRLSVEQRERRRVRSVFSKVVAPDVVNELLQADTTALKGQRRKITVYFADIRGFTKLTDDSRSAAEEHVRKYGLADAEAEAYLEEQAREVLGTVNLYLGAISDTIKRHQGTLDKYIGDCVMAFWGAPVGNDRQAVDCVRAAIEAQIAIYRLNYMRAAENQRRQQENLARAARGLPPLPLFYLLALGSGINTGMATVGLMGSDSHILNYTVFGREVNLASRLEGLSGRARIIISESTHAELQRREPSLADLCCALPPATVKGIREPVKIFEVQWRKGDPAADSFDTGLLIGEGFTPPTGFLYDDPAPAPDRPPISAPTPSPS